MLYILTLVAILILSGIFFVKEEWGLATVLVLLPFERIGSFALTSQGFPVIRPVQIAGSALILAMLARWATQKSTLRHIPAARWLALLTVATIVSASRVHYYQIWQNLVSAMFVFALWYVVAQLATPHRLKLILKSMLGSALVVSVFGLFQYAGDLAGLPTRLTGLLPPYTKAVFGFPRIQSTAMEPLYFANYLLAPFFLLVGLLTRASKNIWLWAAFVIVSLSLVLTMSRGGLIAALFGLALLAAMFIHQRRPSLRQAFVVVGVAGGLVIGAGLVTASASFVTYHNFTQGPHIFIDELTTKLATTGSYTERAAMRQSAQNVFRSSPWWGVGVSGYGAKILNYPEIRGVHWPVANNAFWELLAELGVIGFGCYIAFVLTILWAAFRKSVRSSTLVSTAIACLVAAIIAIFIQYQSFTGFFLTHIWVGLALAAGLGAEEQSWRLKLSNLKYIL